MHQRRAQYRAPRAVIISSPVTDLLMRINTEHLRGKQHERSAHFEHTFTYLLFGVFVLYLFDCHTRVYNAFCGPFHFTLEQFTAHLDMYNELVVDEYGSKSSWFLFHREYLQVELGENQIEQGAKHILRILSDDPPNGRLLYTFNRVKEWNIVQNLRPNKVYVKLAAANQNHLHSRLPYSFRSFTVRTLRCIVRQLDISPSEYIHWIEKSMFVTTIEQIYAKNATTFNMKVIIKCGILIGYLYRAKGDLAYTAYSDSSVKFDKFDIALDASSSYYPHKTFLFGGLLFSWLFIKAFFYLLVYLFHTIYWPTLLIHLAVKRQLKALHIDSVQKLDDLLLNTSDENNYDSRLFLLRERFLLIFNIDWNEYNTSILRQFYVQEPITIIPLRNIIRIEQNEIMATFNSQNVWFSLPTILSISGKHGDEWLHQRLMCISSTYRESCNELERLQEEQRSLATLIAEEEQHQLTSFRSDTEPIWNRLTPASPRFIAEFRLKTPQQVGDDLLDTSCTVCLENFDYGEYYTQWPCEAKHIFHRHCMLQVLRAQNACPLCRHAVEKSDFVSRLMIPEYFYRVFM